MSVFQCENCGCVENTALSSQGFASFVERFNWDYAPERKGKMLCSACGPILFASSKCETRFKGQWHGRFKRVYLPLGKFKTNDKGDLEHIETGDQDYHKYAISVEEATLNES